MAKISAAKAKDEFMGVLERAARKNERIIVTKGKKEIAAVVPIKDVNFLEELEDLLDVQAARAAEAEAKAKVEKPIPWEKARKMLIV